MKTHLYPSGNSLHENTRRAVIDLLNQQLADAIDMSLQAKQAHWNVKGPHFIGLHELFDKIAEEFEDWTDEIAERAVELGGIALGTVQCVSKDSRIKLYPVDLSSGKGHVTALSGSLAAFGASALTAIETAGKLGDADTADLFTGISRGVDKLLWMVEAHLQSKD